MLPADMGIDELRRRAEAWAADDPDPATRGEVRALLDAGDTEGLAARFARPLTFGTAGIRGPLGAGPARMNRAVVRRVTAGLATWLHAHGAAGGVVVGRDARHGSAAFAEEVVRVLAGAGIDVHPFTDPVPTPLVAFAVRHMGAAAGVQITASHNPPSDNGYKVYLAGGLPLLAPHDEDIAEASAAVTSLTALSVADADDPRVHAVPGDVRAAYLAAALGIAGAPASAGPLRLVVTPLHGVAGDLLTEALASAGFTDVTVVAEQARADPDFPTTPFPNPEEPGALDAALSLAAERHADLVLATDPDGDRIAVAIPDGNDWRALSGDETGCLLADHLLTRDAGDPRQPVVATTVVSSSLLERIAEAHGAAYTETLTGFKWLAPVAEQAEAAGQRFVLAYEQALGVMIGEAVRDKDGITAALAVATFAAGRKEAGATVADALDDLARRFGVHATAGRSIRLSDAGQAAAIIDRLRHQTPIEVAGSAVTAVADHAAGIRRHADGTSEGLSTPATELVGLCLADGSRCQVRPSGTEPLLKFYFEAVAAVTDGEVAAARTRAQTRVGELAEALLATVGR